MCLQCECKSVEIGRLGDISVQISVVDHPEWKKDSIGLVISNDPFKVFDPNIKWLKSASFNPSDEEQDDSKFWKNLERVEKELYFDAYDGFRLIINLHRDGYKESFHGYRWSYYFVHKIAEMLQKFKKN